MIEIEELKVYVDDETHTYWVLDEDYGWVRGYSTTNMISSFKPKFDGPYWSTNKAIRKCMGDEAFVEAKRKANLKYPYWIEPPLSFLNDLLKSIDPEKFFEAKKEILDSWSASSTDGTVFHKMMEDKDYDRGYKINPFDGKKYSVKRYNKTKDNQNITSELSELKKGCYPELLVWIKLAPGIYICGQIDTAFITKKGGTAYLTDFKTNDKISTSYYKQYYPPFDHMDACKMIDYSLQLSLYGYVLEQNGYDVGGLLIWHHPNYKESERSKIEVEYMRGEIVEMLDLFVEKTEVVKREEVLMFLKKEDIDEEEII